MGMLLVGYDLNKSGQRYDDLIAELKKNKTYWHHLDSTWLIKTDESASSFCNGLLKAGLIDDNDEVLVLDVTGDTASWYGFNTRGSDWLSNNL